MPGILDQIKKQDLDEQRKVMSLPVSELTSHKYKNGNTALHYLARYGLPSIQEAILSDEALYSVRNKFGETPLHILAEIAHDPAIQRRLLLLPASFTIGDINGETPAHMLALRGDETTKEKLIAKQQPRNDQGDTPAHYIARYGNDKLKGYLIESPLAQIQNNHGDSVLHEVAKYSDLDTKLRSITHPLIDKIKNKQNQTPFDVMSIPATPRVINLVNRHIANPAKKFIMSRYIIKFARLVAEKKDKRGG